MSLGSGTVTQRSANISFKCCKSKQFIHFVCIKCYGIYHKCCIPKFKNKIRFVKDNQLICCEEDSFASDRDNEKDILERTIQDLAEESAMKNTYITKIKADREAFFQEALKREEEMGELLKRQENMIEELNNHIAVLKRQSDISVTSKTKTTNIGTQTRFNIKKTVSTLTDDSYINDKKLSDKNVAKTQINKAQKVVNVANPKIQGVKNNKITRKHFSKNITEPRKRQILLLTDDINITWQVRKWLDTDLFDITSLRKPGAHLYQVLDNIELLAKNYTLQDNIIVVGGSNDIDNGKTPSFRYICNKLKLCVHTNVMFASVPYCNKHSHKNDHIYKFNTKLRDFLDKFNACSEGHFNFVEINSRHWKKFNNYTAASKLVKSLFATKQSQKSLIFIRTSDVIDTDNFSISASVHNLPNITPTVTSINDDVDSSMVSLSDSNGTQESLSNFLYPRLSQMSLLP